MIRNWCATSWCQVFREFYYNLYLNISTFMALNLFYVILSY
jgi:hypothetical protein